MGGAGEIDDREYRAQGLLQARDIADGRVGAEELLIAFALNLDEVLRIRRWLVFVPVEALRGASIALVAMIVPALLRTSERLASAQVESGRAGT
jgi:hypothetical protein